MALRALVTVLTGVFLLTACGGPQPPEAPAPSPETSEGHTQDGLSAHFIQPSNGGFSFRLNHPAHIALFEVVPDRGIAMVYPSGPDQADEQPAGTRWVKFRRTTLNKQRDWYQEESSGPLNQENPDVLKAQGMLFLVASETPLNLSEIESAGGIRRAISDSSARNPYEAMEELVGVILPEREETSWDLDVWMAEPPLGGR